MCTSLPAADSVVVEKIDPAAAGMSAETLTRIAPRMKPFVDGGKAAGIVTLVAHHGHVAGLDAVGYLDLESKTVMRRLAHVTTPSLRACQLYSRGLGIGEIGDRHIEGRFFSYRTVEGQAL